MRFALTVLIALALSPWSAFAAQRPLAILMPGGSGAVKATDFLVRNRARFEQAGFEIVYASTAGQALKAARRGRKNGQKVFFLGISLGVSRAAAAFAAGAPVDAAVFLSGAYSLARVEIGSPGKLPPTLMVHHRADGCATTTPASAEAFRAWAGGKVARLVWISSTGNDLNWSCGPKGAHGFYENDAEALAAAIAFLKSR